MPERAYADIVGNFRRGAAGAYARRGDYEGAAGWVADDPALMASYGELGDRARTREREEEMLGARRSYAGALQSGDYAGAGNIAAKVGDVEGMTGARTAQREVDEQTRVQMWRGAQQSLAELEAIEANGGQGYEEYIARGRGALEQNPDMDPDLRSLIENAPPAFNPRFVGAMRAYATRLRDAALSPEQAATFEMTGRQRDTQERQADISERRAAAAERTAQAAMIRAERVSGDGAPLSDGQRVASASAVRMRTAEQELQRLEGINPSEWANSLEVVPIWGESASAGARSAEQRALDQSSNQWAEAFLRATSGAAVTADEIRRVERVFMPRPGDQPADLARKREARRVAQEAIEMGLPARASRAIDMASGRPAAPASVQEMSTEELERIANGGN